MMQGKSRSTVVWLGLFFILAFTLRIAFGFGTGFDEDTQRYIFTGNDPYYHDRSLRHLVDTGENLDFDSGINYPEGRPNPNPPLYVWTSAPLAVGFDGMGVADPTGLAINIMVGFWGALTIFPIFMLGRDLWNRTAGLWAALFIAVSAPHIQRSVFGYADHDAITMFFVTLAFAFIVKAFMASPDREYVTRWTDSAARKAGLAAVWRENKTAFLWAALAGIALSATAVVWKGYPYALGVMAVGMAVQLVIDHLRNRDSTARYMIYVIPVLLVIAVPWLLYYRAFPFYAATTIVPSIYVLIGMLVAGAVLVPTRNIPSILVFPALLLAGGIGLLLMLVAFPNAGSVVFTGLGYFTQTKLYTTIAEAQRAQLGTIAASFGFFTFLLAFWGFAKSVRQTAKGNASHTLMAAWGAVSLFMAFAASRFIMNAAPVFSLFIGAAMAAIIARLGLGDVVRRYRSQHGQNIASRSVKSLSWRSGVGVALVAVFLVLPNLWIGVDAALSSEYEADHNLPAKRFGAFGISFDLRDNGWIPTMDYLAQQDTEVPLEERPAFIAWWDYGHWAVGMGEHPTVADPFQDHYELAGRFLASESEEEAQSWILILILNYDAAKNGGEFSAPVSQALSARDPTLTQIATTAGFDAQYKLLSSKVNGTAVFDLYDDVAAATGKQVGFMAVDLRMYPISASNAGIFYAPAYLANKNPDDFLMTQVGQGSSMLTQNLYGVDEDGNSYRLAKPTYTDSGGEQWVTYNGYAYPKGRTPLQGAEAASGVPLFSGGETLTPTEKFFNSMYRRAFGSYSAAVPAGDGLAHWRVVQESKGDYFGVPDIRKVALLEYYKGAPLSGRITDSEGNALAGVDVAIVDGYGAAHGAQSTDSFGNYKISAPFSENDDLKLVVRSSGQPIYEAPMPQVTREQAASGMPLPALDVQVPQGEIQGITFENIDGQAGFNATTDRPLAGVSVSFGSFSATSGADGRYLTTGVKPGSYTASASLIGYNNATSSAVVKGGATSWANLTLSVQTSIVTLHFDDNGAPVAAVPMNIAGAATRTTTTNAGGNATATLGPGDYTVKVDYNATVNGVSVRYLASSTFTVQPGGAPLLVNVQRQA